MTAREKLAIEHPGEDIDKLCHDTCPEDYGYLGRFDRCPKDCYEWNAAVVCPKCWNREVKDCTTCIYADVPIDETPCKECDGVSMFQSKNTIVSYYLDHINDNERCPWCMNANGETDLDFSIVDDNFGQYVHQRMIKFCPFCGRRLQNECNQKEDTD